MRKNLHFWAFWAKMANFGQFLAKMGKTGIFFKKAFKTFFSLLKALINCKVSEKVMKGFREKSLRTDGQTRLQRSQRPVDRETNKKLILVPLCLGRLELLKQSNKIDR